MYLERGDGGGGGVSRAVWGRGVWCVVDSRKKTHSRETFLLGWYDELGVDDLVVLPPSPKALLSDLLTVVCTCSVL